MYDQAALLADLETSLSKRPTNWRASALRQLTALFLAGNERLAPDHVALYDLILPRLIESVDQRTLADISAMLAKAPNAPRKTVEALARHKTAAVARPVLESSSGLGDDCLIEVLATCEPDLLLAIARRPSLHEQVSDALLARGDGTANLALFANEGASVSEMGYVQMIDEAKTNGKLLGAICARRDMPTELKPFFEMAAKPAG